jgi:hypothetical protein
VKRFPGFFCDTLHDTKQTLVRFPGSVRKNKLAARISPLAFGNCGYKVCRNWDATDVPVFRMPIEMRSVHDVQKSAFNINIAVLSVTSPPSRTPVLRK